MVTSRAPWKALEFASSRKGGHHVEEFRIRWKRGSSIPSEKRPEKSEKKIRLGRGKKS